MGPPPRALGTQLEPVQTENGIGMKVLEPPPEIKAAPKQSAKAQSWGDWDTPNQSAKLPPWTKDVAITVKAPPVPVARPDPVPGVVKAPPSDGPDPWANPPIIDGVQTTTNQHGAIIER